MINKIGFVHTGVAIADMFKPMVAQKLSKMSSFHIVDDSLIQDLLRAEQMTPGILRRLCKQVELAEEAGADLIMVTCSSIAPAVDVARKLVHVPVMKVDEPMAEKAVSLSDRIGVIATAKTTVGPSVHLVEEKAREAAKEVRVEALLSAEAFDAFLRGDMETHDRIVLENAGGMKGKVGVVLLAQASMGHLAEPMERLLDVPVFTSPPLAMDALVGRVNAA